MWEAVLGPEHPHTATRLNNLGSLLQVQGDLAGARLYYERAFQVFQSGLGEVHPSTPVVRRNLEALAVDSPEEDR
jgi:Tfp pilus assembly protein PilF